MKIENIKLLYIKPEITTRYIDITGRVDNYEIYYPIKSYESMYTKGHTYCSTPYYHYKDIFVETFSFDINSYYFSEDDIWG